MDANTYYIVKSLHLIAFTAWMAGLLYLPRIYVYHADPAITPETSETFKVMERKLLRFIMNPAMILTFIFGIWLAGMTEAFQSGWFHSKMLLVLLLAGFHGACAVWRKRFATDTNPHSARFYRIVNEAPTLLLIAIVFLAIMKPF